ncbi:hypothetical protein HMPREF1141_0985 [Clostridium sp. MSTE9]|nr:hypothetical protein HMPREF1141_0985 [Clostridium sp. MSTE9]
MLDTVLESRFKIVHSFAQKNKRLPVRRRVAIWGQYANRQQNAAGGAQDIQ